MPLANTSSREHVLTAIRGGKPAVVPAGMCLGGSWPISQSGAALSELVGDARTTARIFHDVHESVDADLVMVGTGATALLCGALGSKIVFRSRGAPDIVSDLVTDHDDLVRLDLGSALRDESVVWLRNVAEEVSVLNQGRRAVFASGRAPFSLAAHLAGLERLSRSLYKDQRLARALLQFTTDLSVGYFTMMLSVDGIDGMFIADPTASGDVISRRHYAEFALPGLRQAVQVARDLGKVSMVHICGDVTDRLAMIADSGVDCISLDYKVSLSGAKEIAGGRVSLAGNVNPVDVLEFGSQDEVRRAAEACLREGAGDGGFVLLPGCDIASGVSAANIRAFVETAHNWNS